MKKDWKPIVVDGRETADSLLERAVIAAKAMQEWLRKREYA